jgi:hypothetical protein
MSFDFSSLLWIFIAIALFAGPTRGTMVCRSTRPGDPRN